MIRELTLRIREILLIVIQVIVLGRVWDVIPLTKDVTVVHVTVPVTVLGTRLLATLVPKAKFGTIVKPEPKL